MKVSNIRKAIVLVVAAGAFGLGCELVVDFDRTKIPVEAADSGIPTLDSSFDAPLDTFVPETSTDDGGTDAEASTDAATEDADADAS